MKYKLLTTMLILLIGLMGLANLVTASVAWHVDHSDFTWKEDTTNVIDLDDHVTANNGAVSFTVSNTGLNHIKVTKTGSILTLVPDTNWHGTETMTVTAVDGDNIPVSTSIALNVEGSDAVVSDDIMITKVEVDDVELSATDPNVVRFERGETIEVEVEFVASSRHEDTRVRTWIGGYEFDDVIDTTGIFDVEPGVRYVKKLHLDIPNDIDVEDGGSLSDRFTLHVEVFDKKDTDVEEEFTLKIDKIRHQLNVLDVIFYPSNTVEPGRALRAVVRVENLGQKKEEDILVRVSVPELGVSTRTYIDELAADTEQNEDDEETSSSSRDLVLLIPQDAQPGEYTVEVDVEYSRGHEVLNKKSHILVSGVAPSGVVTPPGVMGQPLISIDATTQDVAQGTESVYKVMVANLGNTRALYTINVEGEDAWGTSRVSPSFISVDANQAGEAFVYIKANENAPVGQQSFRVNVLGDGQLVKTLDLNANVIEPDRGLGVLKSGLEVAFVILIVILIILGLIIAFRKVGQKEAPMRTEEPSDTIGEQTYY